MMNRDQRRNYGGLTVGLVLLGLGVILLLHKFGVITGRIFIPGWWALPIVALGVAKTVGARRGKSVGEGVTLTLIGAWLYLAQSGFRGFTYGNSWPLVLVAIGAGMVARAIANQWMSDRATGSREERHDGNV
jgi:hypothetical protein